MNQPENPGSVWIERVPERMTDAEKSASEVSTFKPYYVEFAPAVAASAIVGTLLDDDEDS